MPDVLYRPNVAAFVLNKNGEILCCERSDYKGHWQLPQGGIDEGESVEEALYRELREEILTDGVVVLGRLDSPVKYDWPERLRHSGFIGQEQHYFLVRLDERGEREFAGLPSEEFQSFEWTGAEEFLRRSVGFKLDTYRFALNLFVRMFPGVIAP